MDCMIRDLSETGACLKFQSERFVPSRFDLLITQEKQLYPAEVVWRNAKDIGIRFTDAP
jgi:hypothetical protein